MRNNNNIRILFLFMLGVNYSIVYATLIQNYKNNTNTISQLLKFRRELSNSYNKHNNHTESNQQITFINNKTIKKNIISNTENKSSNHENFNYNDDVFVEWYIIVLLSILYGIISLMCVMGNGLIIWTVVKNEKFRFVINIFICNLAVADIIIGVLVAPFQFQTALLQRWIFPNILCKIAPFAATLSVNVSILTLVAISIDRYHEILNPYSRKLKFKECFKIIALIWFFSLLLSTIKLYNFKAELIGTKLVCGPVNNVMHKYETIVLIIIQYIIPFFVIFFAYSRIGFFIYFYESPNYLTKNRSKKKRKVIKMILLVITFFMLCWSPLQVFNFLNVVYPDSALFTKLDYNKLIVIWLVFNSLAMSNSCINVFIYGTCSVQFKQEFKKFSTKFCYRKNEKKQNKTSINKNNNDNNKLNEKNNLIQK